MSEKYIRIELTPLAPYFLGGERGLKYDDNDTQMGKGEKYYIKSNLMPNQSALFGVLRFLGIEAPDSHYKLTENDIKKIGEKSYQLNNSQIDKFGMIKKISPLYLTRKEDKELFFPAPMLISAMQSKDEKVKKLENQYEVLETDSGNRWIPLYYREKEADFFRFINLRNGTLLKKKDDNDLYPFRTQTGVIINRKRDYKNGISKYTDDKNFLKKEYVILDDFSFVFYAKVDKGFIDLSKKENRNKSVFIGQGKCPFAAEISDADDCGEEMIGLTAPAFAQAASAKLSTQVTVGREKKDCLYAYLVSDMFYEGNAEQLKGNCVYAMTAQKQYRVFTTNYNSREAVSKVQGKGRFSKQNNVLNLLKAGSTFVFENKEQMEKFKEHIETMPLFAHGQIAGFNGIVCYGPNDNTHSDTEESK